MTQPWPRCGRAGWGPRPPPGGVWSRRWYYEATIPSSGRFSFEATRYPVDPAGGPAPASPCRGAFAYDGIVMGLSLATLRLRRGGSMAKAVDRAGHTSNGTATGLRDAAWGGS